jgi:hypothetical protein
VFVPSDQASEFEWHVYDCETKKVLSYPKAAGIFSIHAYAGGVYDPQNNQVVFVPYAQSAQNAWHTFQNFGSSQISPQFAAHYLFNKCYYSGTLELFVL